jgi:prepilin-type N-terminal cleavage/methylation domain-containing protein/prepilin-type processing-associated H-X9-DG protein
LKTTGSSRTTKALQRATRPCPHPDVPGFTLVELLVVIATVAVLAVLCLPALAGSGLRSRAFQCLDNQKQLALAWKMYADDNHGNFVPNADGPNSVWVYGIMDYSYGTPFGADTNITYLIDPTKGARLGPYIKNPTIFKCPADMSTALPNRQGPPRVRSVSMNAAVGLNINGTSNGKGAWLPSPPYQVYGAESRLGTMAPARLFVFIDEHPDSINDGSFAVQMTSPGSWIDFPAPYHDGGAAISFADGHSEIHKWKVPAALPPITYGSWTSPTQSNPNPDVVWLQQRTSAVGN